MQKNVARIKNFYHQQAQLNHYILKTKGPMLVQVQKK
jgi:hypothetical protein